VQRLPLHRSVAPCGLLVAACIVLGSGEAVAQMAAPDPLTPRLSTDPRNPPRFQQFSRPALVQLGAPSAFTPPASAAGDTGFDSTNTRKAKGKTNTKPKARTDLQAIAPGTAAPVIVSPYQKPATKSGTGAYAAAPGSPPVELGPIRRPPKKRKAHVEPDDPYAALGLRAGAFTLYPAIELIGGYDTNPAHSASAKGATLYAVMPELRAQSNWSRHELKADLRGSYTGYSPDETPTLSRPYLNGKADGRIDVSKLTRIDLGTRVLVSSDNPGSPNLQAGLAKLPIFATFGGSAGVGQKFNRVDLSLKGDAERTVYQQSTLIDGSTAGNAFRNYNQYGVLARAGYELLPGVTPFVELDTDTRRHDLPTDPVGFQRNSKGVTGKLGSTFDLRGTLTGEVALGYTQRTYEDPRLDKLAGLIGNASLIWTANALTTVKLSATSTVGESTITGVSGVLYRDVGLQIDHSFRRWLIGSVKFGFGLDTYKGANVDPSTGIVICDCVVSTPGGTAADRVDKRFSAGVGLTYKLNRSAQIKGELRQDWLRSNVTNADYSASIFLLGLRFQE
jgi:hypothetical protein